jgi:putative transposase
MSGVIKAARLMQEAGLVSTQPRKHRYKITGDESKMAPNLLKRLMFLKKLSKTCSVIF